MTGGGSTTINAGPASSGAEKKGECSNTHCPKKEKCHGRRHCDKGDGRAKIGSRSGIAQAGSFLASIVVATGFLWMSIKSSPKSK